MSVDNVWFCPLRGEENPAYFSPAEFEDRDAIRTQWDKVEQDMRDYFTALRDELLFEKSFPGGEKEVLYLWQVLLHVVNHGTDRRAQIRRIIHDFGVDTAPQDYIFYVNDNL